ncbi:pseudouridine synthase [Vibrio sp. CAIM 722]|uniref:Pseudouridine synthase n=1 Tax=Vibrio eleionomae TaxID=2653505 RepID=A0A7X4LK88_9VIBR|nr:YqcC family protein [Vibrio eleionomae]MZI93508.1 pseudouridine synthase [Vibrio eleionomae]
MSRSVESLVTMLEELEYELRRIGLWQTQVPNMAALQSEQPFALDTLEPHEWLQWIFIPQMLRLLEHDQVPSGFAITPYFEQVWSGKYEYRAILRVLTCIDEVGQ